MFTRHRKKWQALKSWAAITLCVILSLNKPVILELARSKGAWCTMAFNNRHRLIWYLWVRRSLHLPSIPSVIPLGVRETLRSYSGLGQSPVTESLVAFRAPNWSTRESLRMLYTTHNNAVQAFSPTQCGWHLGSLGAVPTDFWSWFPMQPVPMLGSDRLTPCMKSAHWTIIIITINSQNTDRLGFLD